MSTPRINASTPIIDCSAIINLRLSTRSATTPPYGPSSSTGNVCSATTTPILVPEPVSTSTSQDCATVCIQVPTREMAWPRKYLR